MFGLLRSKVHEVLSFVLVNGADLIGDLLEAILQPVTGTLDLFLKDGFRDLADSILVLFNQSQALQEVDGLADNVRPFNGGTGWQLEEELFLQRAEGDTAARAALDEGYKSTGHFGHFFGSRLCDETELRHTALISLEGNVGIYLSIHQFAELITLLLVERSGAGLADILVSCSAHDRGVAPREDFDLVVAHFGAVEERGQNEALQVQHFLAPVAHFLFEDISGASQAVALKCPVFMSDVKNASPSRPNRVSVRARWSVRLTDTTTRGSILGETLATCSRNSAARSSSSWRSSMTGSADRLLAR